MRLGDRLYVSYWHHGLFILDISDMSKPTLVSSFQKGPAFPHPTHTCLPIPDLLANCLRYSVYKILGLTQKAYKTEGRITVTDNSKYGRVLPYPRVSRPNRSLVARSMTIEPGWN
jgi:hypothetical protein